jgi:23S rRNA pseudouridine1911/1915/1917 synthase
MTEKQTEFVITEEDAGERLDKWIANRQQLTRTLVQKMIKDGQIMVNGYSVKTGFKLRGGETITFIEPEPTEPAPLIIPEDLPLVVVYEDEWLAVIDKSAGMVVHPGVGNETGTLVHALLARWPQIADLNDPENRKGIVHRLDKDTSGLLVVAKTDDALSHLMQQFQDRTVDKRYLALLDRKPKTSHGRIEAPIGRDPKQRKKMTVIHTGKEAVTEFIILDDNFRDKATLVEFKLLTGRTHQIRVHAAFINCPIIADRVYGFRKQRTRMKRLFLHAARLSFSHPQTGERMEFESPLPIALVNLMEKLRP